MQTVPREMLIYEFSRKINKIKNAVIIDFFHFHGSQWNFAPKCCTEVGLAKKTIFFVFLPCSPGLSFNRNGTTKFGFLTKNWFRKLHLYQCIFLCFEKITLKKPIFGSVHRCHSTPESRTSFKCCCYWSKQIQRMGSWHKHSCSSTKHNDVIT